MGMWDLQDSRYIRRDGKNSMSGPLILSPGNPSSPGEAVRKAYVDTLTGALPTIADVAAAISLVTGPGGALDTRIAAALLDYLELAGGTMTGALTLAGAPVNPLEAATMGYADLMLPLVGGVLTGALTLSGVPANPLHAATKAYVDALPVAGLPVYDAVVAPAGGDYTSIVAACAGEGAGAKIFVKSGTYTEVASIVMDDGQMLVGENPDTTIIDFGAANLQIIGGGADDNIVVENFMITGSIANYVILLSGDYIRVTNNRIDGSAAGFDGVNLPGDYTILDKNYIYGFNRAGAYGARVNGVCCGNTFASQRRGVLAGSEAMLFGNRTVSLTEEHVHLEQRSQCFGNYFDSNAAVMIAGDNVGIVGNFMGTGGGIEWSGNHDNCLITGNMFRLASIRCASAGSLNNTITGNTFAHSTFGVTLTGTSGFTISGNTFIGVAKISLDAATTLACITGNNLVASTAAVKIIDLGIANLAKNNLGVDSLSEKDFRKMKNTSGGDLDAGDVVAFKAVAAGDEVDTTVAQGDDMVFGMVEDATIVNNAYGYIQVEGKTVRLKVNGTVNIGIGDLLGTLDAAKIAMKAADGDMAFAIALETYAGADSLGVIDALLIKPRKV